MIEPDFEILNILGPEEYLAMKMHITTNMHYQLCNKLVEVAKANIGELPKNIPECVEILEHIKLFEKEFDKDIIKL